MIRDYDYIKNRLLYLYNIPVTDDDLKFFEESDDYNESATDFEYVKSYVLSSLSSVSEDVAVVGGGAVSGMGAVISSQPSSVPGQTTGGGNGFSTPVAGDSFGDGGIVGSGDIGSGWNQSIDNNKNIRSRDSFLPRNRRKEKIKKAIKGLQQVKGTNYSIKPNNEIEYEKSDELKTYVKKFNDFISKDKKD